MREKSTPPIESQVQRMILLLITVVMALVLLSGRDSSAARSAAAPVALLPSISITSPANNSTFAAPATFTLEAKPDAGSSALAAVDFLSCTTALGSSGLGRDYGAPFTQQVSNLAAGVYQFAAIAIDVNFETVTSAPITITVTGPTAPTVKLLTPVTNRIFEAPATIELTAEAQANSGGQVSRVDFYNGATKLGEDTSAPYSFTWTRVAADQQYVLAARVITTGGATANSPPVFVTVTPPVNTLQIKDTAYPIPDDPNLVRYVATAADGGNNANDGRTLNTPLLTLGRAQFVAPNGATIVMRRGTYRNVDRVNFTKKLTLQPYPHEQVWLKGSEIATGWRFDAALGLWVKENWTNEFPLLPSEANALLIDYTRNPLATSRELIFIDGQPLVQVAQYAECTFTPIGCGGGVVKAGTFCHDYAANKVYLKDDPTNRTVEVAKQTFALFLGRTAGAATDASDSIIRGLGFAHYAGTAVMAAALRVKIEDNTFVWNAVEGLTVSGTGNATADPNLERSNCVVRGNTFSYNGRRGMGGSRAHNLLVENNLLSWNNLERFATSWDAAGLKVFRGDEQSVRGNVFEDNLASGLWFDGSVTDATVVHNLFRRNLGNGIFFEISSRGLFASNVLADNDHGMQIRNSNQVQIYNNTFFNNRVQLRVLDDERVNSAEGGNDPAVVSAEIAAGIDWEVRNITVKNNLLGSTLSTVGVAVAVVDEGCGNTGPPCNATEMIMGVMDYNLYSRTGATSPDLIRWKPQGTGSDRLFTTLAAFKSATTFEPHSVEVTASANQLFVNEAAGDYRLAMNSPARIVGEPLPANVAQAIGVPAGVVVGSGALRLPGVGSAVSLSAASYINTTGIAVESLVAGFGVNLATTVQVATSVPLPVNLAGTSIRIKDSAGVERFAPLFFVSPGQINYQIPPGTANGSASLLFSSGDVRARSAEMIEVVLVAPGLFTADSSGRGLPAALVLRVKANGAQQLEPVAQYDAAQNRFVAVPIDLGPEGERVFLILYGAGFRYRSSLAAVSVSLGGVGVEALYAGAQGDFVGLDQINLELPRSLAGRGEVRLELRVDGKAANPVTVQIK